MFIYRLGEMIAAWDGIKNHQPQMSQIESFIRDLTSTQLIKFCRILCKNEESNEFIASSDIVHEQLVRRTTYKEEINVLIPKIEDMQEIAGKYRYKAEEYYTARYCFKDNGKEGRKDNEDEWFGTIFNRPFIRRNVCSN